MFLSNNFAGQSDMRQPINISGLRHLSNQQQASRPQPPSHQFMGMSQPPVQNGFGPHGCFPSSAVSQQQPFSFSSPGVAATNCYLAGFVPNQQHSYNQGRSQPVFPAPSVAATNCPPAGTVPYPKQQLFNSQGRSQPAFTPGVAATNSFSAGVFPHQQQFNPQAQATGEQYSQKAFTALVQGPGVAQNVASTSEYIDLTGDDGQEVQTAAPAPAPPDVPVSAARKTGLVTPNPTPSPPREASTKREAASPREHPPPKEVSPPKQASLPKELSAPEAPSHLHERVNYLKLAIRERDNPCAFRLLRSFTFMKPKQQRHYCSLFWPSNEAAHEEILETAKLSLDFTTIYYHRIWCHAKSAEPMTSAQREEFEEKNEVICAEMARTCKARLQDRRDEENLSELHQALTTTKGKKKDKKIVTAQLKLYKEEKERVEEQKRNRWGRVNGKQASNQLAGQERKERVEEQPAPAPKKRGRPPKVRAMEEEGVVKVKRKLGRPRKVPVVQEPTPDHTDEAVDDGALEAALLAGLSEDIVEDPVEQDEFDAALEAELAASFAEDDHDVVNAGAAVEPSGRLQEHEEEGRVAAAIFEDPSAAYSEEAPVDEGAAVLASSFQEQGQEKEGCDTDSLFGDDSVAVDDVAVEEDDDKDSLFDHSDSIDGAVVEASLPQEEAYEAPTDAINLLDGFDAVDSGDLGEFGWESLMTSNGANDIGAKLDSLLDF